MPTREPTTFAEAIRIERELLIQRAKIAIAIFDKLVIEAKEHEAKVAAIQNEIMHLMLQLRWLMCPISDHPITRQGA